DGDATLADWVADDNQPSEDEIVERVDGWNLMGRYWHRLTAREQKILVRRFGLETGAPQTLDDVAAAEGVTRERIRQIEIRALRKMQRWAKLEDEQGSPGRRCRRSFPVAGEHVSDRVEPHQVDVRRQRHRDPFLAGQLRDAFHDRRLPTHVGDSASGGCAELHYPGGKPPAAGDEAHEVCVGAVDLVAESADLCPNLVDLFPSLVDLCPSLVDLF